MWPAGGVVLQYASTASGTLLASDGSVKGSAAGMDKLAPGRCSYTGLVASSTVRGHAALVQMRHNVTCTLVMLHLAKASVEGGPSNGWTLLPAGATAPHVKAAILGTFQKRDGSEGYRSVSQWAVSRQAGRQAAGLVSLLSLPLMSAGLPVTIEAC
jgi:hypothetical protein